MREKLKYLIPLTVFLLVVGLIVYGSVVDTRLRKYKPGLVCYEDLTFFEKIVCKVNNHDFDTREEKEEAQRKREEQNKNAQEEEIEYKDIIKDYDNFNVINYPCTCVHLYGNVESIQLFDEKEKLYFITLSGKPFAIREMGNELDGLKVGDEVDWKGVAFASEGLVEISLEK